MPNFKLHPAKVTDRIPLLRMLELYQYELSDIWDQDLDVHGEYGYFVDRFWVDQACRPYLARVGGHFAGFALVDGAVKVGTSGRWIDQFFILKKYRRIGLGRALAFEVFAQMPGRWEVGQMTKNFGAQAFWRRVIADASGGNFQEHEVTSGWWKGFIQCFQSSAEGER